MSDMYADTYLEWLHNGEWKRIGWVGSDPRRSADLREHGARLAAEGGHYRLTHDSIYRDGPATVIHNYPVVRAA